MSVSFVKQNNADSTSTTNININQTASGGGSTTSVNILVCYLTPTASLGTITHPAGWTKFYEYIPQDSVKPQLLAYWRTGDNNAAANAVLSWTGASAAVAAGQVSCWDGLNTTNPIINVFGPPPDLVASGTSITNTAIALGTNNSYALCAACGFKAAQNVFTTDSNLTIPTNGNKARSSLAYMLGYDPIASGNTPAYVNSGLVAASYLAAFAMTLRPKISGAGLFFGNHW